MGQIIGISKELSRHLTDLSSHEHHWSITHSMRGMKT